MNDKEIKTTIDLEPQPEQAVSDKQEKPIRIGLVANYSNTDETRILLTPEGCGLLTSAGYNIIMEEGAATDISFPDKAYSEFGVEIVTRDEALKADVVLSYQPLHAKDIKKMRKGASVYSMMGDGMFDIHTIKAALEMRITLGCLDNMLSHNDEPVFANIVDEIDGRAAIIYAQEFLSYVGGGKGVLLASVAGLNPCEVIVIGDGIKAYSAAKAAMAAGAYVTLMNNDISALQMARQYCGDYLNTAAIHPRVLFNKVKSADVILIGECTNPFEFPKNLSVALKESVYVLDFKETQPSLSVPRTVAMALSNVLVNFFNEMLIKGGPENMVINTPGVQEGLITYRGKLVDKLVASYLSLPSVDIKVMTSPSN
jgi:alanine dehydrogenase